MRRSIFSISIIVGCLYTSMAAAEMIHRYSFDSDAADSVSAADGTLMNGASVAGGQVVCDGMDDFVDLPAADIAINTCTAVTLEMWSTQPVDNQSYSMTAAFGDTWDNGTGRDYLMIATTRGDDVSRAAIANTPDQNSPWNDEVYIDGPELNDGLEHQYVLTCDGTTLTYYIDGMEQGTATLGNRTLSGLSNVYAWLGKSVYTDDGTVNGTINEFRIYNTALSALQVQESYLSGPDVVNEPLAQVSESDGSTVLYKLYPEYTDEYEIVLLTQPADDVAMIVTPPMGLSVGSGSGQSRILTFSDQNWDQSQTVTVTITDAGLLGETAVIRHAVQSSDPQYNGLLVRDVAVSIQEDACGVWGYLESDTNFDCRVNLEDFSMLAGLWLRTDAPLDVQVLAQDWLLNTFIYDSQIYPRSIQESDTPFLVDPADIVNTVDEKVYGHFLEHIYHSVNGGLWGELVWNRSFELNGAGGAVWTVEGDDLVQSSLATDIHMEFGQTSWYDYELTLEARKDGGNEGFLILFRASDSDNFYWLNLGGWNNTRHAIEKEVNGGRGTVSDSVSGSIATGQWYDIRIRCEDNRIQVWLDENQILDFTDTSSPHLTGMIGLGTWVTQARYRNIQVTNLSGSTVLHSGLPVVPAAPFAADFWEPFGGGTVSLQTDALNDHYAVHITSAGDAAGIQQDNFAFTPQTYHGSLWMKGDLPAGLSVELLDGTTVIGQITLAAPTADWGEYTFSLIPSAATQDGSLRITLSGAGTVTLDQVSLMGQDAVDTGGYRPDLLAAVADLRPPIIRWPGGCFASLYLWKDAIGPQHERRQYAAYMWDDQDTNSYGTDEFLRMCELMGTEPLLVINTGVLNSACGAPAQFRLPDPNDYLQDALDWMEYCNGDAATTWGAVRAANGHPEPYNVTYWEIDNETWAAGSAAYIAKVQQFAPAMRDKADELGVPIQLIACGGGSYDMDWNRAVIDTCAALVDYISVHHYEGSGGFKSGPITYDGFLTELAAYIAGSDNPDMKIYNSEWNLQTTDWRTGLYAGGILNVYERHGADFTIGGPALFLRHTSATGWDNAFINFDQSGWFPAPNYVVMKLWRDHYAPYRVETTGGDPDLNVCSVLSEDDKTLYIRVVNPDPQDKSVAFEIDGSFLAESAYMHYAAPGDLYARNTLDNPNHVHVQAKVIGLDNHVLRFIMPAYSAGVVTVRAGQP